MAADLTPLDLNALVPCGACGGVLNWFVFQSDGFLPPEASARCDTCSNEWNGVSAPVAWHTLPRHCDQYEEHYIARLLDEVTRLSVENTKLRGEAQTERAAVVAYLHAAGYHATAEAIARGVHMEKA